MNVLYMMVDCTLGCPLLYIMEYVSGEDIDPQGRQVVW